MERSLTLKNSLPCSRKYNACEPNKIARRRWHWKFFSRLSLCKRRQIEKLRHCERQKKSGQREMRRGAYLAISWRRSGRCWEQGLSNFQTIIYLYSSNTTKLCRPLLIHTSSLNI